MRLSAADRLGPFGHAEAVIDVVPVGRGLWLARCECGATEHFPDAESGWNWVLGHPCPPESEPGTIDLTDRADAHRD